MKRLLPIAALALVATACGSEDRIPKKFQTYTGIYGPIQAPTISDDGIVYTWTHSDSQSGTYLHQVRASEFDTRVERPEAAGEGMITEIVAFGDGFLASTDSGLFWYGPAAGIRATFEVPGGRGSEVPVLRSDGGAVVLTSSGGMAFDDEAQVLHVVEDRAWYPSMYIATTGNGVAALDSDNAMLRWLDGDLAEVWSIDVPVGVGLTPVLIEAGQDRLVYTDGGGLLQAIERSTGNVDWELDLGESILELRAWGDGDLLARLGSGTLVTVSSSGREQNRTLIEYTTLGSVTLDDTGDIWFGCGVAICRFNKSLREEKRWVFFEPEDLYVGSEPRTEIVHHNGFAYWGRYVLSEAAVMAELSWVPGGVSTAPTGWPGAAGGVDRGRRSGWARED